MVKPCYIDSHGMKKGAWSEEEDNKLRGHIQWYGHQNWRLLPEYAGLARSGKSCRLRWVNYLKPGVRRGNYSKEEVHLIMELHAKLGNKWSAIARKFPGRTDNDIKNYWHAHVEKRHKRNAAATGKTKQQPCETSPKSEILKEEQPNKIIPRVAILNELAPKDVVVAESSFIQDSENSVSLLSNANCVTHDSTCVDSVERNLWNEPADQINYFESLPELNYEELLSPNPYVLNHHHCLAEDSTSSSDAFAETQDNTWAEPEVGGLFSPDFLYFDDNINLFWQ
ncbi:myb domain protein 15 [Forsythia ovata]|uniref:Myb domain protein 15 n=1 Tax=Forsythia ovata TaxID=205694 RepID=A0ABD1SBQ5_9LAMI